MSDRRTHNKIFRSHDQASDDDCEAASRPAQRRHPVLLSRIRPSTFAPVRFRSKSLRLIYGKPLPSVVKPSKACQNFPNGEDLPDAILVGAPFRRCYCDDRHVGRRGGRTKLLKCADIVAKVENRTTLTISRKLIFELLRCCVAFQRHYGGL